MKTEKTDVYIGIDPDSEKSGVGVVYVADRRVESFSATFPELMTYLQYIGRGFKDGGKPLKAHIIIEGGWLNDSNWHVRGKQMSPAKAAAMGRNVGMNHQTGLLIEQMCGALCLLHEVVKPLPKHWRGKDGKITSEELAYFTGYKERSNQDQRDAVLLAWVHAGLPVRVKPIGKGGE